MRTTLACLVSLLLLAACGCAKKPVIEGLAPVNALEADGLRVQIELPRRELTTGETLPVTVTVTNTTGQPIRIDSPTGAPVIIRVRRHTSLYSEEVKRYPQSATANILSWVRPARQSRTFVLMVPVEPDWPVEEILHVSAELNGYAKVAPGIAVTVHAPKK